MDFSKFLENFSNSLDLYVLVNVRKVKVEEIARA